MALNNFTPTAFGQMIVAAYVSQNQAVPGGGGPTLLVTNLGPGAAAVLLVATDTATVTEQTGVVIPPLGSQPLAVNGNGFIAALCIGGSNCKICLSQGT